MGLLSAKATTFPSDIVLGERYLDAQTGFEGVATSVTFYQHACERVCLESYDASRQQVKEVVFDAPRLTNVKTKKVATVEKTGGPGDGVDTGRRIAGQPMVGVR